MARHFLILVVDDEPMICSMLRSVLEDVSDVTVLCAKDGKKALKMLTIIKPNLVLLDMMMPEVNGFEVIRQMKSSPTTSDIPVIALTASVSRLQALDAGCDGYLGKPFEIDYLLRTIAKYQARYLPPPGGVAFSAGLPLAFVLSPKALVLPPALLSISVPSRVSCAGDRYA